MAQQSLNPFTNTVSNSALVEVESGRAMQEVQAAMVIAKKYPRDQRAAMDRILNACTRETLANQAIYVYPKGGQQIEGASIRLAEVVAQNWGNMQYGVLELEQNDGVSICQAYAWDLETNTRKSINYHVEHVRFTKKYGKTPLTDPRDIYEMVSNQGSRRVRNCVLAIIPGDVVEAAERQCKITQTDNTPVTPDTIKDTIKAFSTYGITEEMLNKRIGHSMQGIKSPQLLNLRRIYQSLKDGIGKAKDFFEDAAGAEIKPPQSKSKPAANKKTGKSEPATEAGGSSDDEIFSMIESAKSVDELTVVQDLIKDFPKEQFDFFNTAINKKLKVLGV